MLLKPQTRWGFCLGFGVGGFAGGQRFPPTSVLGGAKAVSPLKTESAETHRVLSFLRWESVKRIAISPLASAGVYCGELKLSKRHRERRRII